MKSPSPAAIDSDVLDRARTLEPDRYLAATLAPHAVRGDLIALAAFAADLARIPASVTEPMMGEIRLQWWRDQFAALAAGEASSHPLADALGHAIRRHALPLPLLVAMTEARAFDLYPDPLPDDVALDGYLAKTEAIPFELALRVLSVADATAGRIAITAGRAFGLARLALALPERWSAGRPVLPPSWFGAAGTSIDSQLARADPDGARRLVDNLLAASARALAAVEPQIGVLSRQHRSGLLPLAAIDLYASAARAQAAGGMRERRVVSPLRRVLKLAFARLRGSPP